MFGLIRAIFEKKVMKFLKIEKKNFTVLTPKGLPFGKKIEKIENFWVFFIKNYTIST